MTLTVFLAVLGAALLHASWNAVIKQGADKLSGILVMTITQGLIGFGVAMTLPWPTAETWPWLIASGVLHAAYKLFLLNAYVHGDLSRVYPIARGTAPFLVLIAGAFLLSDQMTGTEIAGVIVLICGILMMAQGVWSGGESRKLLPFALGAAIATASYSIVDGLGARISGNVVSYVAWMFALDLLVLLPGAWVFYRRLPLPTTLRGWAPGMIAAAASYGAYAVAVWAMTVAPIALVTALRETSILFAVLIGWLIFGERMNRGKAVASGLILLGVVMTRI